MSHVQALPRLGSGVPALNSGLQRLYRRAVAAVSRWYRRRAAIRQLQALNDHYLADIGLERDRIVPTLDALIEAGDRRA